MEDVENVNDVSSAHWMLGVKSKQQVPCLPSTCLEVPEEVEGEGFFHFYNKALVVAYFCHKVSG